MSPVVRFKLGEDNPLLATLAQEGTFTLIVCLQIALIKMGKFNTLLLRVNFDVRTHLQMI